MDMECVFKEKVIACALKKFEAHAIIEKDRIVSDVHISFLKLKADRL